MGLEKEKLVPLVTAAQSGDSNALNALFNVYYNDVYYFALKTLKDSDLACDITQETFVEIFTTIGSLKEPAAFVSWSKQITYHQCTRYFKKKKDVLVDENEDGTSLFDTVEEDNEDFIPDAALDKEDFRKTILSMIDKLSEEQRAAVLMYYFDELSVSQIAQIQGVSEGTVKSRLNYARKAIKASVEDYEKKHNIKLHSIAAAPLLLWLFRTDKAGHILSPSSVQTLASRISDIVGFTLRTAFSNLNPASPAVDMMSSSAQHAAKTAQKAVGKATLTGAKKGGMSLFAKLGFFVLSIGGITILGGAAVAAAILFGGSLFGDSSSKLPTVADEPAAVVYPIETQSATAAPYSSEVLIPFGEISRLGDRLAGVYANPHYVIDTDGNLYSATDCDRVLANTADMTEQYSFDNAFVYRDHSGIYHVLMEGHEVGTFSGIKGIPVGVYYAESIYDGIRLLNVLSHENNKTLYLSSFTDDGAVFEQANTELECFVRNPNKRFKSFEYITCSARDDGLVFYAVSGDKGLCGVITGTYEADFRFRDNKVTLYSADIYSRDISQFFDISGYSPTPLYWDRQNHTLSFDGYDSIALLNGYTSDNVRQLLIVGGTSIAVFDDGQVWFCSFGEWKRCETLSAYGESGQLLQLFKMNDLSYDLNQFDRCSDKLIVMMDDHKLYEVSYTEWQGDF